MQFFANAKHQNSYLLLTKSDLFVTTAVQSVTLIKQNSIAVKES